VRQVPSQFTFAAPEVEYWSQPPDKQPAGDPLVDIGGASVATQNRTRHPEALGITVVIGRNRLPPRLSVHSRAPSRLKGRDGRP